MSDKDLEQELALYLRARFTLLVIATTEEERAVDVVQEACAATDKNLWSWDMSQGLRQLRGGSEQQPIRDPLAILDEIAKATRDGVLLLRDFHEVWSSPPVKRRLRNLAQSLKFTQSTLVVTSPSPKLPPELVDEAVIVEVPPPDADELHEVLEHLARTPNVRINLTDLGREKIIQAALGLTTRQAQRVFAKAIVADGVLDDRDIELVTREKKQIIRQSEALEYYAVLEAEQDVGGLEVLKGWLKLRERAFTREAADYGLPAPKGVALIGIPGTGKSLTAKMIAGLWRLPLLRLDVGALFGSLVGESEERARRALRVSETVAPCVLWIDEMEKAFAHGGGDSGTSTRVFGTILTWMQEKTAPCFVVATANDIASMPPELLRRGRFDEVFFLDLPTQEEREAIFDVHLRKRRRMASDFDVASLAAASVGYVGAEIEQAVIDAMYVGFNEHREFVTKDILSAVARQVPLSRSQREVVSSLRNWLEEGRAQSASFPQVEEAKERFVPLEISSVS